MPVSGVEVIGLREFVRKIRGANPALAIEMRLGFKRIADVVANTARPAVPELTGTLRRSLRPKSSQKSAEVAMGGNRVPYAGFIEFGGSVGRDKSVTRPFVRQGRYLRPAYERQRSFVEIEAVRLIDRVAKDLS
jgi:phage gpG-like protein